MHPTRWLAVVVGGFLACCLGLSAATSYDPGRFDKEILVPASRDAIQLEILDNGDIVFVEFWGTVKRWNARTKAITTLGMVPTHAKGEIGLLGFAVAPDFLQSGHLYVLFCPLKKRDTMRVSRFTVSGDRMSADSEHVLLSWPYDTEKIFHMGGAMYMDGKGLLYIGNGDNCFWQPGLPVDFRPGMKTSDAFRTAGNSRDLRGKILRIRPKAAGGYDIPKDNLFADGKDGAPEVFAMGVRNPFRMTVDDTTGILYFGDVGPNVFPELGIKPLGYDEINATAVAGNFGWPSFIGPNEPYPLYDFEKKQVVGTYSPDRPENPSPNNTGLKKLPPAQPALVWYGNNISKKFPTLGTGGRSIMAGPVYHYNPQGSSALRLPKALDGHLFIYEWMRNWIQVVDLDSKGPQVKPFLPEWNLRRPIDMKMGPDGTLYMIEYGDRWWENTDSRIARVVYRRGNRPPQAVIVASTTAGRHPLKLKLSAAESRDPDGDSLTYSWDIPRAGKDLYITYDKPGTYQVTLTVTDSSGATSQATQTIDVGNARPQPQFKKPRHGSFFDWKKDVNYEISVTDDSEVDPRLITMHGEFRNRRFLTDGEEEIQHPGLARMRKSTCFACHLSNVASSGPAYEEVAEKYKGDRKARQILARKIIDGGVGVWGGVPMPPHPNHEMHETLAMVDWILSLNRNVSSAPRVGSKGSYAAPAQPDTHVNEGVLVLTAGYTDAGAEGAPALRGESIVVLHSRRKKAALYDVNHGMQYVQQVDGEKAVLGHFDDGDYIVFRDMNLAGMKKIRVRAGVLTEHEGQVELRRNSPTGSLLAQVKVGPTGEGQFEEKAAALKSKDELIDLCVVARVSGKTGVLGLNWIEFLE